jgi:hypothetical protein
LQILDEGCAGPGRIHLGREQVEGRLEPPGRLIGVAEQLGETIGIFDRKARKAIEHMFASE